MSEQEREWMLLPLDEKMARRQGIPLKVPVPKEEFEGLADAGLSGEKLEAWIKDFLANAPVAKDGNWRRRNSEIVSQLEGYVDKQPLWKKAQELFAKNEFEAATKTLKRITVMMPDDHAAKMNYANALANQGDHDKAFKQLRQIRETFDGDADYHVTVAQLHVTRGDHAAAIAELLVALEHQPDHFGAMDALAKLGVLARIYENPKDASSLTFVRADSLLDYLGELWSAEARDAAYFIEQMAYHESERRYEVALEAARRAIGAGDGLVERAEQGQINALRELGRLDEALAAAQAYAEKAPESAAAHVELAKSLERAGKKNEASEAIETALRCDPGDQEALCERFWPDDRGDIALVAEAVPPLAKWSEEHPDSAGALRSLARAKLVIGADDEALGLFEKAVALAPNDDDLRSEWWAELARRTRYQAIVSDAEKLGEMGGRDWRLRWNEAEAYAGLKRMMEARGCFMQINADESLHVDIRKRAKRAAMELGGA